MKLDLNQEIIDHFERVRALAEEAAMDGEESYASRSSAQSAFSAIIRDLVKSQESIINMDRLIRTEQALVEAAKVIFPPEEYHIFTNKLMELLHDEPDS